MKDFLNAYMGKNRHVTQQARDSISAVFRETVSVINASLGKSALRRGGALNAAILDAVMVGVARRMASGELKTPRSLMGCYEKLLANSAFQSATTAGTADDENVKRRLELATKAFAKAK